MCMPDDRSNAAVAVADSLAPSDVVLGVLDRAGDRGAVSRADASEAMSQIAVRRAYLLKELALVREETARLFPAVYCARGIKAAMREFGLGTTAALALRKRLNLPRLSFPAANHATPSILEKRPELRLEFPRVYAEVHNSAKETGRRLGLPTTTARRIRDRLRLPIGPYGGAITGPRKRNRLKKDG